MTTRSIPPLNFSTGSKSRSPARGSLSFTGEKPKRLSSAASRNPPKPYGSPALCNGLPNRTNPNEPPPLRCFLSGKHNFKFVVVKSAEPQNPECPVSRCYLVPQLDLIPGERRVRQSFGNVSNECHKLNGNGTRKGLVPALAATVLNNS